MEIVKETTNKPLRQLHKAEEACRHCLNNVVYGAITTDICSCSLHWQFVDNQRAKGCKGVKAIPICFSDAKKAALEVKLSMILLKIKQVLNDDETSANLYTLKSFFFQYEPVTCQSI